MLQVSLGLSWALFVNEVIGSAMQQWYVRLSKGIAGPFTEARVRKLFSEGIIDPGTSVRQGEDGEWQTLGSVLSIGGTETRKKRVTTSKKSSASDPRKLMQRRALIASVVVCGLTAIVILSFAIGRGSREEELALKTQPAPATQSIASPQPKTEAPPSASQSLSSEPSNGKDSISAASPTRQSASSKKMTHDEAAVTKPAAIISPIARIALRPPVAEQLAQPAPPGKPDEPKEVKDAELGRLIDRLNLELIPEDGLARLAELRKQIILSDKQKNRLDTEEKRWKERQEKGQVRLGTRWVKPEDRKAGEEKSKRLVRQATPLLAVGSFKEAISFLEEASDADGNAIEADLKLGLLRSFDWSPLLDPDVAEKHYEEVLKRAPDNVPALNNVAVAELKQKKYSQAIQHLSRGATLAPRCQEVAQNLGRALFLGGQKRINLTSPDERAFAEVYASLIAEGKGKEANISKGYQLMPILLPKGEREKPEPDGDRGKDLILTSTGSGFAVGPNRVLTNRHVVEHRHLGIADEVRIAVSAQGQQVKFLKGSVVTVCEEADLALLKFDALDAKPLILREATSRLGEEIAIVGFPRPDQLGDDLKFVKGSINAVQLKSLLFDCVANQGNSGGPVLSMTGEVVSIYTFVRTVGDDVRTAHGGGVPSVIARKFLIDHVPQIPVFDGQPGKDWPTLIEAVRDSIFKVEVYHNAGSPALQAASARIAAGHSSVFEDRTCPTCSGRGALPCRGGCVKGAVKITWTEEGRGVVFGKEVSIPVIKSRIEACDACGGRGAIDCPLCDRGIDRALAK